MPRPSTADADIAQAPTVRVRAAELGYTPADDGARGPAIESWALRDFALDLPAGQWTCLLGPSGVGKSTVLRHLAGLLPNSEANVESSDGLPLIGRVAYMDQRDLLLPWLRVVDNVLLGSRLRGERGGRERAMSLLDDVGLADRAGDWPERLSGGMRQRVALARTLMESAPIVLMDEPFSALDALTRYRIQALAVRLLHGRTVLLVTHDPHEALRLGHHIHVLTGEPAQLGSALQPATPTPREPVDTETERLLPSLLAALGMHADAASG